MTDKELKEFERKRLIKQRGEKLQKEVERSAIGARKATECAAERLELVRKVAKAFVASKAQADDESVVEGVCAASDAAFAGEDASGALSASADTLVAAVAKTAVVAPRKRGRPPLTEEERAEKKAERKKLLKIKKK